MTEKERNFLTQIINDDILERLTLKRRYNFLNNNMNIILKPEEFNFLKEVQDFCLEYEKKVDHTEDIYQWYPDFGKKGYICRVHSFKEIDMEQKPWGLTFDMMRHFSLDFFDPQFSWTVDASVLCVNPLFEHHNNVDVRVKALKELITGEAVGCVCITEPERGSDATHQMTVSERKDDGLIINGVKAFNTNAPKSKYGILYATTEMNNPNTMTQSLVEFPGAEGIKMERIMIPATPKAHLGKETFTNYFVPNERIMGDVGQGKTHMFEGLVLERVGIAQCNLSEAWNAITHASIYSNLRKQMGKEIIRHQGVGFILTDLWTRVTHLTRAMLDVCRSYDSLRIKYDDKIPGNIQKSFVTYASQLKYDCARTNSEVVNECLNLMGGAGVNDNTMMWDLLGLSRIQEIVGGTRQIQQYILSGALRSLYKMDNEE